MNILTRGKHWVKINRRLVIILLIAAVLLFYRISHVDMLGDDAHYSVRSIGLLDYMFGDDQFQSTPFQWFDRFPWWANLSFHDHPLLIFFIQHIFFKFHVSIFFAKLPYALMALGTITLTYAWTKRLWGESVALLSAALLVLNAHFIWFGRSAFMESGVLFFISLAWYYFIRFLEDNRQWWKFGLFLGLMLEAKFTTFFIVPTILVYLLIARRKLFREPKLYYAVALALVIFSPVIIYNLAMYQSTGHFGLQLARLFNQQGPWHMSGALSNPIQGLLAAPRALAQSISIPYVILFAFSAGYLCIRRREELLFGLPIIFILLEDATIGAKDPYSIFLAPLIALALVGAWKEFGITRLRRQIGIGGALLAGLYFLIFTINSNLTITSRGAGGWLRAETTTRNYGMVQLDQYLNKLIATDPTLTQFDPYGFIKIKSAKLKPYLLPATNAELEKRSEHAHVILFDGNINWFARVWLFERRRFYNNIPLFSLNEENIIKEQLILDSFYFIKVTAHGPLDSELTENGDQTEQNILKLGITPDTLYRDDGQVAFKVYHVVQDKNGKVL